MRANSGSNPFSKVLLVVTAAGILLAQTISATQGAHGEIMIQTGSQSADLQAPDIQASLTIMASVNGNNLPENDAAHSYDPVSLSANARYVVFASDATNLVSGDTNGVSDIFLRDLWTNQTSRVSTGDLGVEANGRSTWPAISANGRYVVFQSTATNLAPDDSSSNDDIFRKNLITGHTELVSFAADNSRSSYGYSRRPAVSGDGRYVAFDSTGDDIVPGNPMLYVSDVFVRDMDFRTNERVSVDSSGHQISAVGNVASITPSISSDGMLVTFDSNSNQLVQPDTNNFDIFVHNRLTGTTRMVTVDHNGIQQPGASDDWAVISGNGRFVAFSTSAKLDQNDKNGKTDVYIRDLLMAQTIRVSLASDGSEANEFSRYPAISYDGNLIAFNSYASNLVPGDTNFVQDTFVRNRITGQTLRVSTASDGSQANRYSYNFAAISASGLVAAFTSDASNLVPLDTNSKTDVFVHFLPGDQVNNNTISGRVLDTLGNPVPGVVVSDDQGDAAITNSDGGYTITGLQIDGYTLHASPGSSLFPGFAPDKITIPILYGNLTGQDFTALHPIILLVHGIMTFDTVGGGDQCEQTPLGPYDLQNSFGSGHGVAPAYFAETADILTTQGFKVYQAQLTTTPSVTPPIEVNAACLARQVNAILAQPENAGQKIILVAHSMGGLIARSYLRTLSSSQASRMFSALYTFGTMNAGIATENLLHFLLDRNPITGLSAAAFCLAHEGLCQFETAQVLKFNLATPNQPGLKYTFVGGDSSDSGGWLFGNILVPLDGPNDGIVGQYSAVGQLYTKNCFPGCPQVVRGKADHYWTGETHASVMGTPAYFDGGKPYLSTTSIACLLVWLRQPGVCYAVSPPQQSGALDPIHLQASLPTYSLVSSHHGVISGGQIISKTIQLDSPSVALIGLSWQDGKAGLAIKTPDGKTITPEYASQHPTEAVFKVTSASGLQTPTFAYSLTAPLPGVYTAVITTSLATPTSTLFTLSTFSLSPRTLSLASDKTSYATGETAHLTVTLQNNGSVLDGGLITAVVHRPDTISEPLLFSLHNGVYSADYLVPNAPGYLLVELNASGVDGAIPYTRQTSTLLTVNSSTVTLTGTYSDEAPLDLQTGKIPDLKIGVGLNSTTIGQFLISGDVESGGEVVAHSTLSVTLSSGVQSVYLTFDGDELRNSGKNGPYHLVNLTLIGLRSGGIPVFNLADSGYLTGAYSFTEFAATCFTLTLAHMGIMGGTVTPDLAPDCRNGTQYTIGSHVTLTASLRPGFRFGGWRGDDRGDALSLEVLMDRDHTEVVVYVAPTVYLPVIFR